MDRHLVRRSDRVTVAIVAVVAAGLAACGRAPAAPPRNVVLIMADDLGWGELGSYGQRLIPTPHIDSLAADGMRFTRFYAGAPVCAPSRCVLMTGKHTGHAEIRGNRQAAKAFPEFTEGQHPLSAEAVTFPSLLRAAGYATGAMGKWGLGPVGSTGDPQRHGFDLFFGYNCQAVAHSYYPATLWRNAERVPLNERPIPGHAKRPEGEVAAADFIGTAYAPHAMVAEAEAFVADHADRPFFLYLPFIEPHLALHPPQATVDRFPREWDEQPYRGENGYLPHPRPRAAYAASIAELDDHVGRVLAALERAGVADRTLVLFTSDNGTTHGGGTGPFHVGGADPPFFASTAGLRGAKGSVYEGGLRVPFIARLPGVIAAGVVNDTVAWSADLFPTICAACGVEPPADLDGTSLWDLLTGRADSLPDRKPPLWVFPEYGGQVAVLLGDMKALRRKLNAATPDPWEAYDLAADPAEAHDLAATRPEVIAAAEAVLAREVAENEVFPVPIPAAESASADQPRSRTEIDVRGWTVRVDDRLLEGGDEAELGTRAVEFLSGKLADIQAVVPRDKLPLLERVTIVLDVRCGDLGSMQYHPSGDWLADHGYPRSLEKCVHIPIAAQLPVARSINEQPWVILHELAHAYHDQVLGFEEPRVLAAYDAYKRGGRGDATLLYDGRRVRHYALTDHKEFFAEMTEAFFGSNDFFPFNRAELGDAEPAIMELMRSVWLGQ